MLPSCDFVSFVVMAVKLSHYRGTGSILPRIRYNRKFMLRYFTAGESHGEALVAFLSGIPAGLKIDQTFLDRELWRRQQGYGRGGRMKIERDTAHILSAGILARR